MMNETTVTVVGMICSEIRYTHPDDAAPTARFQIRNTPRHFDKRTNTWTNGDPNYFNATCYRTLADHVASSMGVGDPVVATGRLRITRWRRNEENMVTAELDVQAIGHDLRWGTTVYRRATPPGATRIPGPGRGREATLATAASAGAGTSAGTAVAAGAGVGAGAGAGTPELEPVGAGVGARASAEARAEAKTNASAEATAASPALAAGPGAGTTTDPSDAGSTPTTEAMSLPAAA